MEQNEILREVEALVERLNSSKVRKLRPPALQRFLGSSYWAYVTPLPSHHGFFYPEKT